MRHVLGKDFRGSSTGDPPSDLQGAVFPKSAMRDDYREKQAWRNLLNDENRQFIPIGLLHWQKLADRA